MSEKARSSIEPHDTKPPGDSPGADKHVYPSRPLKTGTCELQVLSLEFKIGAQLCARWSAAADQCSRLTGADPEFNQQNAQLVRLSKKRRKLTAMVTAGIGTGSSEDVPREIVREEAELCRNPAQQAFNALGGRLDTRRLIDALEQPFVYRVSHRPVVTVERCFTATSALEEKIEAFL